MHGIVRVAGMSVAVWASMLGEARAQEPPAPEAAPPPAEETPPKPVPNTPPAAGYPTALVARPLLLPAGGIEGSASLIATRTNLGANVTGDGDATISGYVLAPRVRAGFSSVELEAGLGIFLLEQAPDDLGFGDPDRLQELYMAARLRRSADTSVGLELTAYGVASDFPLLRPALTLQRKVHLSPAAAYDGTLAVGFQRIGGDSGDTPSALILESRSRIQAQVTPTVAAEGRVRLHYLDPIGDEDSFFQTTTIGLEVGVGAVVAVSPIFDVFASVDVVETGEFTTKVFTIGASSRRVP